MSTWDEKAAKAAVESRHAIYDEGFWGYSDQSDAQDDGFENGARWQREALLTPEVVERVADILEALDGDDYLTVARAALTVAIGDNDE